VPAPKTVYPTIVGGIPAGLDVDSSLGRFFVADAAGLIWSTDAPTGTERPTLGVPINLAAFNAGFPVDLASDSTTNRLFVSARKCPPEPDSGNVPYGCVLVIDVNTATLLKSISLPASPGDLRVDGDIGMLYVAAPERQELFQVNASNGEVLGYLKDMPQVTSLALDLQRHLLYAGHLAGQVSVIDARSGSVMARPSVTQAGLTSVAAARGLGYAVNTATHELAVVDAGGQSINRFVLPQEPAAVVAAEDSGAVYVLTSGSESIIRIDPTDGTELGRVMIASRNGRTSTRPNDIQSLRPRLVIDPVADTVYATQPEAGTLVAAADSAFPPLARAISQPVTSASPSDGDIPEVLRPAEVNSGPLNASQP
jgi:DNA-binding beta-propeller fold protein YncE